MNAQSPAGDAPAAGTSGAPGAPSVTVRDEGRVRVLTLDRPARRNALDTSMRQALLGALEEAARDPSVGAIVITGAGKAFAAGADLGELLQRDSDAQRAFLQPPHIYSAVEEHSKPVLAAINGHALGAGLELATACDMRIAAPHAKLGQPEIHFALIPGGGGTQRLVRLVGRGHASRLVLTGDAVEAQHALAMGLVDEVDHDPVARAVAIAAAMARHDPEALAEAKAALHAAVAEPYDDGLRNEVDHFVRLHSRPEARQRIEAFLAKADR